MKVKSQQSPFICDLELTRPASNFKKSFDLILICLFSQTDTESYHLKINQKYL